MVYVVNGIYKTYSGRVVVFLGKVRGTKHSNGDTLELVDGYMYWDITDRLNGGSQIYKKAFVQDLINSHNEELITVSKEPKNNLVEYLGQMGDVIPNGLEYIRGCDKLNIKRVSQGN